MLFKYLNVCALTYQFFRMDCVRCNRWFISHALCDVRLYPFLLVTSSGRAGKTRSWNWGCSYSSCSVVISFWERLRPGKKCP